MAALAGLCAVAGCGAREPAEPAALAARLATPVPALAARLAARPATWQREGNRLSSPGWRSARLGPRYEIGALLPERASDPLRVGIGQSARLTLELSPEGAAAAPVEDDAGRAVYRGAYPHADAVFVADADRVELFLVLRDAGAPHEFSWRVSRPAGLPKTRREPGGGLAFLDEGGNARLRVLPPFALDAKGQRREAELGWDGVRLVVRLDTRGLAFPVLLDPAIETGVWERRSPGQGPPVRDAFAMAYDAYRQKLMLHGGWDGTTSYGDTWAWDGDVWTQVSSTGVAARYGHAMVYDSSRQAVVLYGGHFPSGTNSAYSYQWNGTAWVTITASGPPARYHHGMAYDVARNRVVVFGGWDGTTDFGDTWELSGSSWSLRASSGPAARREAVMDYEPTGTGVMLFGGAYSAAATRLGDTWSWNGSTWSQLSTTGVSARKGAAMAWNPGRSRMTIVGGYAGSYSYFTYEWNGSSWVSAIGATNPPARAGHALAYDSQHGQMVLFGGLTASARLGDTWVRSGVEWSQVGAVSPPPRRSYCVAYHPGRARVVLFGGYDGTTYLGDTWEWDGTSWSLRATTGPSARQWCAMAYDGTNVVLFGGTNAAVLGDTWTWSGTTWTQLTPASAPSARSRAAVAYDSARDRIVLFGGTSTGTNYLNDTWEWTGATWTYRGTAVVPTGRFAHTLAYDALHGATVLFGGWNGARLNDTWTYDGTNWYSRSPAVKPSVRNYHGMTYDSVRGRVVLFGGLSGGYLQDTWEWNHTTWTQLASGGPGSRLYHDVVYDAARKQVVLFGGYNGTSHLGDTWVYHTHGGPCAAATDCDTGACVDGVCCEQASCGTCAACNLAAEPGVCSPVLDGDDADTCTGVNTCDASGACRLKSGQTCTSAAQCASGNCVDGRCCTSACTTPCKSCANVTGTCTTNIAQYSEDTSASPACTGTSSCDGAGSCKQDNGQSCSQASLCASGYCVDGTCCSGACTTTCKSCANAAGACTTNVAAGQPDTNSSPQCSGTSACSGAGLCVKVNGQACTAAAECLSGYCVDGTCCSSTCTAPCKSCANASGSCTTDVAQLAEDANASPPCDGTSSCDGAGQCKKDMGQSCTGASECASGYCVDGTCCAEACTTACRSCANAAGTCTTYVAAFVEDGNASPPCNGTSACDGAGLCKSDSGQACGSPATCVSGYCVDGTCCQNSCATQCKSCANAAGTCTTSVALGQVDNNASPACIAPNACDGGGSCRKQNGQACAAGGECASGYCVDGTCCGSACTAPCLSCANAAGTCTSYVARYAEDASSSPPCDGPMACDGAGVCKSDSGQACAAAGACVSDYCVDGTCCTSACTMTCRSCANVAGACTTLVALGLEDPNGQPACTGAYACDGAGGCDLKSGQACTGDAQCATGHCVDGTCCQDPCTTPCKSCANAAGACTTNVVVWSADADAVPACQGDSACDGLGGCRKLNGQACAAAGDCVSGLCVDGVCCNDTCALTCRGCNLAGSAGTCTNVPVGTVDPGTCNAPSACDGGGGCKKTNGQGCSGAGDCLSGFCIDGVCCDTLCDVECRACNVAGSTGVCTFVPLYQGDPGTCVSPNTCDGNGACRGGNGVSCASGAGCATGFCIDGVCCNEACTTTCMSCASGSCGFVPGGQADDVPAAACSGAYACDGSGVCKKRNGQACGGGGECLSSRCVDGVCCESACATDCLSCNVAGSAGSCVPVTAFATDGTCAAPNACDGNGGCKKQNGQSCASGGECVSGSCADGTCCGSACTTACKSCANAAGACTTDIAAGQPDTNASPACVAPNACDGSGGCKKQNGQACAGGGECVSGYCVDGTCCASTCTTTCKSCANPAGTCVSDVAAGQPDDNGSPACVAPQACDGAGACKKSNGESCGAGSECVSGHCADERCCASACTGTCQTCAGATPGTCTGVPPYQSDPDTCVAPNACTASGSCRKQDGVGCGAGAECVSGYCVDGLCCHTGCTETCQACNLAGSPGTCAVVPAFLTDPGTCGAPSACDGSGACKKSNGQACGTGTECVSGACIDGFCCQDACPATCMTCGLSGSEGQCVNVPNGGTDTGCSGSQACDGAGACKLVGGVACTVNAQCNPPYCVDGVCCGTDCTTSCMACNLSTSPGTCANLPLGSGDNHPVAACTGSNQCDGSGACKKLNGQSCSGAGECLSGYCADGRCCQSSCSTDCQACNLSGLEGTCANVLSGATDGACTGGSACDGAGGCKLILGQGCTLDTQCLSAFCVDGVCCDGRCHGTCESCNQAASLGFCRPEPTGTNPGGECGSGACAGTCQPGRWCQYPNGTECAPQSCSGGTLTLADSCDASGGCVDNGTAPCPGSLHCNPGGTACLDTCAGTSDCLPGNYCDGGACRPLKTTGTPCGAALECQSASCVDGVCCDGSCSATCRACNLAGSVGTCAFVAPSQTDDTCSAPGACDGAGVCKSTGGQGCGAAADCISGNCVDGVCCDTACAGTCRACDLSGSVGTCGNVSLGVIDPGTCSAPNACDGAGGCKKTDGQTCAASGECVSGFCVDSVCCASPCAGTCQACNVAGSPGTCASVLQNETDPGTCSAPRACDGAGACQGATGQACGAASDCASGHCADGVCCGAACDGTCQACNLSGSVGTCAAVLPFQTDADTCVAPGSCDGAGACKSNSGQPCGTGADCVTGQCVDGTCCVDACTATCKSCANAAGTCTTNVAPGLLDGNASPACTAPQACDGAGACKLASGRPCTAAGDCVSGYCVDGTCCQTACTAACRSCANADGTCSTLVPAGVEDANASPACSDANACDGNGTCKKKAGRDCAVAGDCVSGHCVDGTCCTTGCTALCMSCANGAGTCTTPVPGGVEDLNSQPACTAGSTCDGAGSCGLKDGEGCTLAAQCVSGHCVDGVCCNAACPGTCQACNVSGSVGSCAYVPAGQTDAATCSVPQACDGAGACKSTDGEGCSGDAQCVSGHCADGVCCNAACTGTCQACNVAGSVGACSNVPQLQSDPGTCVVPGQCDGQGGCKSSNAQPCGAAIECASGFCIDAVCCNEACTAACRTCGGGTCSDVAAGQQDDVPAGICTGGFACNGAGGCKKAAGQSCGAAADCLSGFCVDGVCCASSCSATCTSCNQAGYEGSCRNVSAYATDGACAGAYACDGNGGCKKMAGQTCAAGLDCLSGYCVDGTCCTSACLTKCMACNVDAHAGECWPEPDGSNPSGECGAGSCAGACQAGACLYPGASTECAAQSCAGALLAPPDVCDGTGACHDAGTQTCPGGYVCNGDETACLGSCTLQGHCQSTFYCDLSTSSCAMKRPAGQPCLNTYECSSGNCIDGVCCTGACSQPCYACNLAGQLGTCTPLPALQADDVPAGACTGSSRCDGSGACRAAGGQDCADDGDCATGHCVDGVCCDRACDQICEACNRSGAEGSCGNVPAFAEDTGSCAAPNSCDGAGACKKNDAQPCADGAECVSGHCVDGFCCASACATACMTCGLAGSEGQCVNVPNGGIDTGCSGDQACDGAGDCKLVGGVACTANAQCNPPFCVDGVCCDGDCTTPCTACNLLGTAGTCTNLPLGRIDDFPANACTSGSQCDGVGTCKKLTGQPCGFATECLSGYCADDFCCDADCTATCKACNLTGRQGTCDNVAAGSVDGICSGAGACDGLGGCKKINGEGCGIGSECLSGHCADGVCCNSSCGGRCLACNLQGNVGTCSFEEIGSNPGDECGAGLCAGFCNGAGACQYPGASTQCATQYCADATVYLADICDGNGGCYDSGAQLCPSGYHCNPGGTACLSACGAQGDCQAGYFCTVATGACGLKKGLGQGCDQAFECQSARCVDGVCCDGDCDVPCLACDLATSPGTCVAMPVGVKDGNPAGACVGGLSCDGAGGCRKDPGQTCALGAECVSGMCVDGVCCTSGCTGTCQTCSLASSLGTCAHVAAGQPDADTCVFPEACDGTGACKKTAGLACTGGGECVSGHCADAVCCDLACGGVCQSCGLAGREGVCRDVPVYQTDSGTCVAPNACDGVGACKKADGQTCAGGGECVSGHCTDGVCCQEACTTACRSCALSGQTGTCGLVPAGQGDNVPAGACVGGSRCDGAGVCKKEGGQVCTDPSGSECLSGFCADGFCCDTACGEECKACNLTGKQGACSFVPNGFGDGTCAGTQACNGAGVCKKTPGEGCTAAADCLSGNCADGVCCDGSCGGRCRACNLTGWVGQCRLYGQGEDPESECGSGTCGGTCDGFGTCMFPGAAKSCAPQACAGFNLAPADACDGAGVCLDSGSHPCTGGFVCNVAGTACLSVCATQPECQPTSYCDLAIGSCKNKSANGTVCGHAYECQSGHCADGVCCDSSCDGVCEQCNLPPTEGACVAVASGAADPRGRCLGTGECGGTCDGQRACSYPDGSHSCQPQTCVSGVVTRASVCDGKGACAAQGTQFCDGFACQGTGCRTSCGADAECAPGWTCDLLLGVCSGGQAPGSICTLDAQCASGSCAGGRCCAAPCAHADGTCGGSCDPSGVCSYPDAATACGLCQGCDGQGACLGTPTDDPGCPEVDCSALDDTCGTYRAITTNRCRAFGVCKAAPADCTGVEATAAGTACGGASCAAETETRHECDGQGACVSRDVSCHPYVCADPSGCSSSCAGDGDCSVGRTCDTATGSCRGLPGDACGADGQCQSGYCTDAVCCDARCDGRCERCGATGACAPLPAGADPDEECAGTGVCGGTCDGAGACQYPGLVTACALCEACNAVGACGAQPVDDPSCGTIACSALSTPCRTYTDLTANRCVALGQCVQPDVLTCTGYSDTPEGTACTCVAGAGSCVSGECRCAAADGGVDGGADGPVDAGAGGGLDAPPPLPDAVAPAADAPAPPQGGGCRAASAAAGGELLLGLALLCGAGLGRRRRARSHGGGTGPAAVSPAGRPSGRRGEPRGG